MIIEWKFPRQNQRQHRQLRSRIEHRGGRKCAGPLACGHREDLSTGKNIHATRMDHETPRTIGTVPIYQALEKSMAAPRI